MFEAVTLTKNTDPDKYSYSGYGIRFDSRSLFPVPNSDWGKNLAIFRVDNSSSVRIDMKKDFLVLGKSPTQGLDDTLITAETEYSVKDTIKAYFS